MDKQVVKWRAVLCKDIRGEDADVRFPEVLDNSYRYSLVSRILAMEKKTPISFERAVQSIHEKWMEAFKARDIPKINWYYDNFLAWVSDQGYHIELVGDEFEPFVSQSFDS